MLRTMLACGMDVTVHATEEQLIAFRYMMQIFAHLAFYTKRELFTP